MDLTVGSFLDLARFSNMSNPNPNQGQRAPSQEPHSGNRRLVPVPVHPNMTPGVYTSDEMIAAGALLELSRNPRPSAPECHAALTLMNLNRHDAHMAEQNKAEATSTQRRGTDSTISTLTTDPDETLSEASSDHKNQNENKAELPRPLRRQGTDSSDSTLSTDSEATCSEVSSDGDMTPPPRRGPTLAPEPFHYQRARWHFKRKAHAATLTKQGRPRTQPRTLVEGFPGVDEKIPWGITEEDLIKLYPNHLYGQYLEQLIRSGWTARAIAHLAGGEGTLKLATLRQRIYKIKETMETMDSD